MIQFKSLTTWVDALATSSKILTENIIKFCLAEGIANVNLILPFAICDKDLLELEKNMGSIRTICCKIENNKLKLPWNYYPTIFLGSYLLISNDFFWRIFCRGQLKIFCMHGDKIVSYPLYKHLLRILHLIIYKIRTQQGGRLKNFILSRSTKNPKLFAFIKKIYHLLSGSMSSHPIHHSESAISEFSLILKNISEQKNNQYFIPRRVILVNGGLAPGGAERQIVNTLIGLKSQPIESVALLCEYLDTVQGLDFYLPLVKSYNIEVASFKTTVKLTDISFKDLDSNIASLLSYLPYHIAEEILNAYFEFLTRRPEVVHAWQDSSSIKSGIAAIMAGVPKIILSGRNVAPINFAYHQPYMKMVYEALAQFPNVKFVNNSNAGAIDYANWLQFPKERFEVIRNGVNFESLKKLSHEEMTEFRNKLGIPEDAYVIGSIFRFYPEKRPLLWIETAIKVAEKNPKCVFLLLGEGPLGNEMRSLIQKSPYQSRFYLIGNNPDIKFALSVMDVFLLCSKFEGTPNVVLEAQWMGVPVVALDAGGTAEAVQDGVTGRITSDVNPALIANIIEEILKNASDWDRVKREGPKFVRDRFGLEKMIQTTIASYAFDG